MDKREAEKRNLEMTIWAQRCMVIGMVLATLISCGIDIAYHVGNGSRILLYIAAFFGAFALGGRFFKRIGPQFEISDKAKFEEKMFKLDAAMIIGFGLSMFFLKYAMPETASFDSLRLGDAIFLASSGMMSLLAVTCFMFAFVLHNWKIDITRKLIQQGGQE